MELRLSSWILAFCLMLSGCASTTPANQSDAQTADVAQQEEMLTPVSPEAAMEQSKEQQRRDTEKTIYMVFGAYLLFWVAVAGIFVACAYGAC